MQLFHKQCGGEISGTWQRVDSWLAAAEADAEGRLLGPAEGQIESDDFWTALGFECNECGQKWNVKQGKAIPPDWTTEEN